MQMATGKSKVLKILPQAFHFVPVEPEVAARHLQLLALVEGYAVEANSLVSLCTLHQGNISQALLALQCSATTGFQWTPTTSTSRSTSSQQTKKNGETIFPPFYLLFF